MLGAILAGAVLGAATLVILNGRRRRLRPKAVPIKSKEGADRGRS